MGIDEGQIFDINLENSKFRAHKQMTTDQLTYSHKFCCFILLDYFPHIAMVFLLMAVFILEDVLNVWTN
jgi:hypothetical protein